jgi:hypothetical protein
VREELFVSIIRLILHLFLLPVRQIVRSKDLTCHDDFFQGETLIMKTRLY